MSFTTIAAAILITAGLIGMWAASLLAHPIGACPRCRGRRLHRQLLTHRLVPCHPCGGTGLWRRIGATFIHRTYWSMRDDTRRRDHLTALEQHATPLPRPPHRTTDTEITNPERHQP